MTTATYPTSRHHGHASAGRSPAGGLRRILRGAGSAVMRAQEARARRIYTEALMALSDAQLAEMGLRRDGIGAAVRVVPSRR